MVQFEQGPEGRWRSRAALEPQLPGEGPWHWLQAVGEAGGWWEGRNQEHVGKMDG